MKLTADAVSAFFISSPEGLTNLRNIADGADIFRAHAYIMCQFKESASARSRIRSAIRETEWYKVMAAQVALSTKKKEEDWGPAHCYLPFSVPPTVSINCKNVAMTPVLKKGSKVETVECDIKIPPLEDCEFQNLIDSFEALIEGDTLELLLELPQDFPEMYAKLPSSLSAFKMVLWKRTWEKRCAIIGSLRSAIDLIQNGYSHVAMACAGVSSSYEDAGTQEQIREDVNPLSLLELKKKLEQRKGPLPRRKGKTDYFHGAGIGQYIPDGDANINIEDVFNVGNIISKWMPKSQEPKNLDDVKILVEQPVIAQMVRVPTGVSHGQSQPIFSPLPRMSEEKLRKSLENGWKGQTSICCDISIQSHVGFGVPIVVFIALLDTRTTCAEEAYLTGAYVDIGRNKASILSVPLINLPLGETIEDYDNFLNGLCLVFYYQHNRGFRPGIPLLSYGAVEFTELTASTNYRTKSKDSWSEITGRNSSHGKRIVSGFNTLQTLEKDLNEAIPSLEEVEIVVPHVAPSLPSYISQGKVYHPIEEENSKFAIPKCRVPSTTGRINLGGKYLGNPKHVHLPMGQIADPNHLFSVIIKVPKDAKKGNVLKTINIWDCVNEKETRRRLDWIRDVLSFPVFHLTFHTTTNQYIGAAIGVAMDWFNRFPAGPQIGVDTANEFPNVGPITLRKGVHQFDWDIKEKTGVAMSMLSDYYDLAPRMILYMMSTNQVVQANDWYVTLSVSMTHNPTKEFRGDAMFSYPVEPKDTLIIGRNFGPYTVPSNSPSASIIDLNLARFRDSYYGKGRFISPWRAYLENFMGFGGDFVFEFIPCSSVMVGCKIRACMWVNITTPPTFHETCIIEHQDLEERTEFTLAVRAPRGKLANHRSVAKLALIPIAGVSAPTDFGKDFEYILRLKEIRNMSYGPKLFTDEWVQLFWIDDFTKDDFVLIVDGQMTPVESPGCKILFNPTAFIHMLRTTGMCEGRLDLEATWSYANKLGNTEGHVVFSHGFASGSDSICGSSKTITNSAGRYLAESIQVGSLAGPVSSTDANLNRWVTIRFLKGTQIEQFHMNVRPHSGFKFYGDSCYYSI
uniref:Polyprotein n=1 Tax=Gentiana ecaudata nepovirus TaxID=3115767 RepID=A0AAT9JAR4_9SECO